MAPARSARNPVDLLANVRDELVHGATVGDEDLVQYRREDLHNRCVAFPPVHRPGVVKALDKGAQIQILQLGVGLERTLLTALSHRCTLDLRAGSKWASLARISCILGPQSIFSNSQQASGYSA